MKVVKKDGKEVYESASKKVKEKAIDKAEEMFAKITGGAAKKPWKKKVPIKPPGEDLDPGEFNINKNPETGKPLPGKESLFIDPLALKK